MKTVVICAKEDGSVMVGALGDGESYTNSETEGGEGGNMMKANNVQQALGIARDLLSEPTEGDQMAESDVNAGFGQVNQGDAPPSKGGSPYA
jgi:hypothetical protein